MTTMTVPEEDTRVQLEVAPADLEGARVAAVDAEHVAASEMLTAAVRRAGPDSYEVTAPLEFRFERLRDTVAVGMGIWVGDWFGVLPMSAHRLMPGDTLTVALRQGVAACR
jgi:hypothetical protein